MPAVIPAFRPSRLRTTAAGLALALALIAVSAGPAAAEPGPLQTTGKIVAGSQLRMPGVRCSAGLVVQKNGVIANLSPYARAIRYVVTAKHCFSRGDEVSYGDEIVGTAIWKDPHNDIALVRIEPLSEGSRSCAPTSAGFHCVGSVTYTPRAVGRVIIASLRTRGEEKVPVLQTGSPAVGTIFCLSAAQVRSDCSLRSSRSTPDMGLQDGEEVAVSGDGRGGPGDSGGLIVSPTQIAYGILNGAVTSNGGLFIRYTRISTFFEHVPGSYSLAAP